MNFINNTKIQNRLKLILVLPLLFLAFILSKETYDQYGNLKRAKITQNIATISTMTAAIAHALQEERGMTIAVLANSDQQRQGQLPALRGETDRRINALKDFLASSGEGRFNPALSKKLDDVFSSLAKIVAARQQVDSFAIGGGDAFVAYAESIGEIRATVRLISQVIPDQELMRLVAAHYNFLELTMRLHGEKMLMTNTFANNEFATLMFMRFAEGLAEQKVYIENFLTLADPQVAEFYQGKMRDQAINQVAGMRQIAIDRRFGGGFDVNPDRWSTAITAKIGLMNEVESRLISDYISAAEQHRKSTLLGLAVKFGLGFIVFWSSVLTAVFVSFNVVKTLTRISTDVNDSSAQVALASHELSATSQAVAGSSSQQAAAVEQTSAAIEEMSAMISRDADNASQADTLMQEANQVLGKADGSMKNLTLSMKEINDASAETQKIVKTIDEIAFQTNLLALNAAVEAARAGEAGAGFAVVADEVRNLAMRAAEAAKNTSVLIEGTMKKVRSGSVLVSETSESFATARQSVEKIAVLLRELATASKEEAVAVRQVNEAISHIDSATQQNAASAEESAAAAEELSGQADAIKHKIRELLVLVGKNNDEPVHTVNKRRQEAAGRQSAPTAAGKPTLPGRGHAPGFVTGGGKTSVKKQGSHGATGSPVRKQDPAKMIPFEDDDFKDF
jgi:methyl-accepting chemotaxis protein